MVENTAGKILRVLGLYVPTQFQPYVYAANVCSNEKNSNQNHPYNHL
jgi:hypothetical protein